MAIEKSSLSKASNGIRSVYQKARDVIQKGSLDYGIELLKSILEQDPGIVEVRQVLRNTEREKLDDMGAFAQFYATLRTGKYVMKGRAQLRKKPMEAMKNAENALALTLKCESALNLLADAAQALDAPFIAAEAIEIIIDFHPENESILKKLAGIYESMGEGRNLLKVRQRIADRNPGNLEAQAALRAAAALATMEQGRWNDRGASYQDKLKVQDEDSALTGDRIIRAADDIKDMIRRYEKQIKEGEKSIDTHRKLAELYMRDERYNDAINEYNWIVKAMGTLDPAIDKSIERATVAIDEAKLEELKETGASEEEIKALENKIYDYKLERYEDRVKTYPNDLQLRYELAELYWEGHEINKALEQFQLAQRNPQRRLNAIVFLGRCFSEKGQYDMAVEQFKKALSEMPIMDKEKMNALYNLGVTSEKMGNTAEAMDAFKQIYAHNVNYMDVGERMNVYYAQQGQKN